MHNNHIKTKNLWLALITLVLFGCDDTTGNLGIGMLPNSDGKSVHTSTFAVITDDYLSGPVFAKTNIGYVGRFTDHEHGFGEYEGSFLTELNCMDNLTFPKAYHPVSYRNQENMIGTPQESIELVQLSIAYDEFFGDSITPMEVSVYELDKANLVSDSSRHYTSINPNEYTTKTKLLGKKSFSAVNFADSTRFNNSYIHTVDISINKQLGIDFIEKNHLNDGTFANSESFKNFFKGIYIASENGDGTVLYIKHAILEIRFKGFVLDSVGNKLKKHNSNQDSIRSQYRRFASTMEVVQANNIDNSKGHLEEKVNSSGQTYLKSPAGIFTRVQLPIEEIFNKSNIEAVNIDTDTINAVRLIFNAFREQESPNKFSMKAPQTVLLIRKKEADDFFINNLIGNNRTSYETVFSNNQYAFPNITRLVTTIARELEEARKETGFNEQKWKEDNALVLIPISRERVEDSSGWRTTNVKHDMRPAFVRLKEGTGIEDKDGFNIEVVYTRFNQ